MRTIQDLKSGEDASLGTSRLVVAALEMDIQDLSENNESNKKEEAIMTFDTECVNQMRQRSTANGPHRRTTIFGFIIVMVAPGSAIPAAVGNDALLGVLTLVWSLLWPLGLAAVKGCATHGSNHHRTANTH